MTDTPTAGRRIVVGVDGSDPSKASLVRAAELADLIGGELEIVHAWNFLDQPPGEFDPHYGEEEARAKIEAFVTGALGLIPANATVTLVNDHAAPALLDRAEGAYLLVVGARGLGGFKGLVLGSVSQHLVHHAPCPVVIVR